MITIRFGVDFVFDHYRHFHHLTQTASNEGKVRSIVIDMAMTSHMDNAGLGMLLLLPNQAAQHGVAVKLVNSNAPNIRKVLEVIKLGGFLDDGE